MHFCSHHLAKRDNASKIVVKATAALQIPTEETWKNNKWLNWKWTCLLPSSSFQSSMNWVTKHLNQVRIIAERTHGIRIGCSSTKSMEIAVVIIIIKHNNAKWQRNQFSLADGMRMKEIRVRVVIIIIIILKRTAFRSVICMEWWEMHSQSSRCISS